jgi:hypothetical protein
MLEDGRSRETRRTALGVESEQVIVGLAPDDDSAAPVASNYDKTLRPLGGFVHAAENHSSLAVSSTEHHGPGRWTDSWSWPMRQVRAKRLRRS